MLKELDDNRLLAEIKACAGDEQKLTQLVLDYLSEVDRRRLYALRGYPNLFEFCVKELGYSESSAHRRIATMRVIKMIPEAKAKLANRAVNLSTLTQLQGFIRREEKIKNIKLTPETKLELLKKIENKSQRECEIEFVKFSPEAALAREAIRPLTADLSEIKVVVRNDVVKRLEELRHLTAHQNVQTLGDLIEKLAEIGLKALSPKISKKVNKSRFKRYPNGQQSVTSAAEVRVEPNVSVKDIVQHDTSTENLNSVRVKHHPRYISRRLKRQVWRRDNGECQYIDAQTQKRCRYRRGLEYDHIIPLARGGRTSAENLRLLCFAHNQLAALREFPREHMQKFILSLN